jgi:hypothetical protein
MTRKTPAVTRVAACIRAETGVAPSIASGNHVCNPICADLPIEPINKQKHITSKHNKWWPKHKNVDVKKYGDKEKITAKSVVLKK